MYQIDKNDPELLNRAKREANALLIHIKNVGYTDKEILEELKRKLANAISIIYIFAERFQNEHHKDTAEFINKIINGKILSPLTLANDEFNEDNVNIRSSRIVKRRKHIYDLGAFDLEIRHIYNNDIKEEVPLMFTHVSHPKNIVDVPIIHINAGGVFIGKAFDLAALRTDSKLNKAYVPKDPIHLPVSIIYVGSQRFYTIDKREPKLKALNEFFFIEQFNDNLKSIFDVRKYKKLPKEEKVKKHK